ncbi:hypothetical protein Pmani_013598 [Petrolisthes manimaculis]|uniref:Uncharacterized protein n=1 Tax=Petrolisthes manimaculis TaxID=1843537 RepID=A0AAE1PUL5_9EUCA|nr:hypothetical protein Pmani_013598 [Petrolisthes manimaculis]
MAAVLPRDSVVTYKPSWGAKVNLSTTDHVALADTGPFIPLKADFGPEDEKSPSYPARGRLKSPLLQNGSVTGPFPTQFSTHSISAELNHSYGSLSSLCHANSNGSVAHLARAALTRANTLRSTTGPVKGSAGTNISNNSSVASTPECPASPIKSPHLPIRTNSTSSNNSLATVLDRPTSPVITPHLPSKPTNNVIPSPDHTTSPIRLPHFPNRTYSSGSDTNDSRPSSVHSTNTEEATIAITINVDEDEEEDNEEDQEDIEVRNLRAELEERGIRKARIDRVDIHERPGRFKLCNTENRRLRNPLLSLDSRSRRLDLDDRRRRKPRVVMKSNSLNFTPLIVSQQPPQRNYQECSRPTITPTAINLQQRRSHLVPDPSRRAQGSFRSNKTVSFDCETRTETFETDLTESENDEREYTHLMNHYNRRPVVRVPLPLLADETYMPPGKEEQDFLPKVLCFALALVITGGILYGLNVLISRMNMSLFSA